MNRYYCSTGERVSESTIQSRYSHALRSWYPSGWATCEGCGGRATETSHIVAKARCKELHRTELIWTQENTFPACRKCHAAWEALKGEAWKELKNIKRLLYVEEKYDPQGYAARIQSGGYS